MRQLLESCQLNLSSSDQRYWMLNADFSYTWQSSDKQQSERMTLSLNCHSIKGLATPPHGIKGNTTILCSLQVFESEGLFSLGQAQ